MHREKPNRLCKFFSLPWRDKRLHVTVALWMLVVKLALFLLPFRQVRRWAECGRLTTPEQPGSADEIVRVVYAVERIGHALSRLGTNCLPQALVACRLIRKKGYDVTLKIGVRKVAGNGLAAHAWLVHGDRVILGDLPSLGRFRPFPRLQGART